jgi:hypothetical protein
MQWNGVRPRRRAGVAPRVCGRVGNGRGREARQGAMRIFLEIPIPPSSSPARRRPPAASAREPASTNTRCAIWRSLGPREGRGRSRRGSREGTVRGIAHRMKPEWWAAGRCGGKGVPEKMRMAPCRASICLPFPTSPGKLGAPCPCRRAGHGVAHGEPATTSRLYQKSAKNPFPEFVVQGRGTFRGPPDRRPATSIRE